VNIDPELVPEIGM